MLSRRAPMMPLLAFAVAAAALPSAFEARAQTRLSLYTGTSSTSSSAVDVSQPALGTQATFRDVHWSARPFHPAPYYGLRLTRFAHAQSRWGVGLDYTHYKVYAQVDRPVRADGTWQGTAVTGSAPLSQYVQRLELSHGVNLLTVQALYRWTEPPLAGVPLLPYVGAGVGSYWPHTESAVAGIAHEAGYRRTGVAVQLLAGARYAISDRWGVFAEARFDRGTARVDVAAGQARVPLRTAHLVVGADLTF